MSFVPKHPQPFSINVAIELSIPEITEEIARLQLSLQQLEATQKQLTDYLSGSDDDLITAFDENKATIASQEERIMMLRVALERKGATAANNAHYAPPAATAASVVNRDAPASSTAPSESTEEEGAGIYL